MTSERSAAAPNVVATYADMEQARKAITALEQGGVEGGNISLEGRAAEQAANRPDVPARDAAVARRVTGFSIMGAAAGAMAGAIIGVVAAGLIFGLNGQALWASTLGMAVAGLAIGGLVAPIAVIGQSPAWETAQQDAPAPGRVRVSVQSTNRDDVQRAMEILRGTDALGVERIDAGGRALPVEQR